MKLRTCFLPELGSDLQVAMFATKSVPITIMIAPLKHTHSCSATHGCFAVWPQSPPKIVSDNFSVPIQKSMCNVKTQLHRIGFSQFGHENA